MRNNSVLPSSSDVNTTLLKVFSEYFHSISKQCYHHFKIVLNTCSSKKDGLLLQTDKRHFENSTIRFPMQLKDSLVLVKYS